MSQVRPWCPSTLVSQAAACRDKGGAGSTCLPRQGQLVKISFPPPRAFVHPLQHPLDEGWQSSRSAGSPDGRWPSWGRGCSQPCADITPQLVVFSSARFFIGSPDHFGNSFTVMLSHKNSSCFLKVSETVFAILLVPMNHSQVQLESYFIFLLIPTVSFPGTSQMLSGLLACPGPLVLLTNPPEPQASP